MTSWTMVALAIAMSAQGVDPPALERAPDPHGLLRFGPVNDALPAPASAPADVPDRAAIGELVVELLGWIGDHTDYDIAPLRVRPPAVVLVEPGEEIVYEGETLVPEPGLRALYDVTTRRIHLVLPWRATDPVDRSVLLHEIVHDVQLNSRHWYCPEDTEWQAYKLQDAWLAEHGLASGFDWLQVYFLARCPADIHP